jgi:hypothetical protein
VITVIGGAFDLFIGVGYHSGARTRGGKSNECWTQNFGATPLCSAAIGAEDLLARGGM